ncbi:MAG: Ig-like domain-containing protein [Bacilli bacterium]|nr:Ig-like domain-containing protein [Bacilli bacterium]
MKKKLIILPLIAAMFLAGCGDEETNEDNTTNENANNESNNGENNNNGIDDNNGDELNEDVDPPEVIRKDLGSALKKDYKNMSVSFALNSTEVGQEYGYEYYVGDNDFVAVLDGTTAETYGSDYAWSFYSFYEGKSYSYWKGSSYVTEGWVSNGSKGYPVGIDYAYFYMPYFLANITEDDVSNVMGAYVVKPESMEKVMNGLKFTWLTNYITYLDIFVNSDGYINRIRGFDDPNNDDYGFEVRLSDFGTTKAPLVTLPPEIGPTTVKTYVEMIGHEEIPDIYMTSMNIVINDTVTSDDTYDIIMYPDDVVDVSFTYEPSNANKREVNWISTNKDVAIVSYGQVSGHQLIRAAHPGETEIYVSHINEYKETITSKRIKVLVKEPKQVEESASDVYRFAFTGYTGSDGHNTIGAVNTLPGGNAPFTIKSWRMTTRTGENSDHFDDDDIILYSDAASSNLFNERFEDEVIFDFENQQINKISFLYGLYYDNNASQILSNFESATLSTSNDGVDWDVIDLTDEFVAAFSKSTSGTDENTLFGITPKVMTKEFLPATMVKIVIKAKNVGGNGLGIGMTNFVFSADETCHNYNDVDAVPVTSITVTAPRTKLKLGNSMKFSSVIAPENASNKVVRWVSSDNEVLSIDSRSGLATALKAGTAKVTAVSTSNDGVTSNEFEVTVYEQEEIYDPNNFLVGNAFTATNVTSGMNTYDAVSIEFKNNTTAYVTFLVTAAGLSFESKITATYEEFDSLSKVYTFSGSNDSIIKFTVADDGSSITVTMELNGSYTLGNDGLGVILGKAD